MMFQHTPTVSKRVFRGVLFSLSALCAFAQAVSNSRPAAAPVGLHAAPTPALDSSDSYILGPEDQIIVRVLHAEDFNEKPLQIDRDGLIVLPLIGGVQAAGVTVRQLERSVSEKMSQYVREPQATVTVAEYRSQPVSLLGSFNTPGVQQVRGTKTLTQMIALAGGLRPDAGNTATIIRQAEWGPLPLSTAHSENNGQTFAATVNIRDLLSAAKPELNIPIRPYDSITVPRASLVYVVGEVMRAGGFTLHEDESISVLQALAMAGGTTRTASGRNARILRAQPGRPERVETTVDLRKLASGSGPDLALHADDILFIPTNVPKAAVLRATEAAINIGTGLAIFGR